jgi:hypothetical protein
MVKIKNSKFKATILQTQNTLSKNEPHLTENSG